jgi:TetR/AcrR family transcriptional regulator
MTADVDSTPPTQLDGRARILAAALRVFASHGFEGSSLRQIATEADAQHQLVVYHFKTKDALWRAVIASIFEESWREQGPLDYWAARLKTVGPAVALREMLRAFANFSAQHPQFQRMLSFEGAEDNQRLEWLIQTIARPHFELSVAAIRAAQEAGLAHPGDPGRLHYAVIAIITHSVTYAKEFRLMTGLDPFSAKQVECTVELACRVLGLPGPERS